MTRVRIVVQPDAGARLPRRVRVATRRHFALWLRGARPYRMRSWAEIWREINDDIARRLTPEMIAALYPLETPLRSRARESEDHVHVQWINSRSATK